MNQPHCALYLPPSSQVHLQCSSNLLAESSTASTQMRGVLQDAQASSPFCMMPYPCGPSANSSGNSSSDTSSHPLSDCKHSAAHGKQQPQQQQQPQPQQEVTDWDNMGSLPSAAAATLVASLDAAFTLATLRQKPRTNEPEASPGSPILQSHRCKALVQQGMASASAKPHEPPPPPPAAAAAAGGTGQATSPQVDKQSDKSRCPARVPSSRYYGVYWCNSNNRWKVQLVVWVNGKRTYFLNRQFRSELEAATCYDVFHIALRGADAAITNFQPEQYSASDIAAAAQQIVERHPWITLPLPSGPIGTHKRRAAYPLQLEAEMAEQEQPQQGLGDEFATGRSSRSSKRRLVGLQQQEQQQEQPGQQQGVDAEFVGNSRGRSSTWRLGPMLLLQQRMPSCSPPETPSAREGTQEQQEGYDRLHCKGMLQQQQQQVVDPLWGNVLGSLQQQHQSQPHNHQQQQDPVSSFQGLAWSVAHRAWLTTLAITVAGRTRSLFEQSFQQEAAAARAYDIAVIAAATATDTRGSESWPSYDLVDMGKVQQQLSQLGLRLNFPNTCYSLYDVHTMRAHIKGKCPDLELPLAGKVFVGRGRMVGAAAAAAGGGGGGGCVAAAVAAVAAGGGGTGVVLKPSRQKQQQQQQQQQPSSTDVGPVEMNCRMDVNELQQHKQLCFAADGRPTAGFKQEHGQPALQQKEHHGWLHGGMLVGMLGHGKEDACQLKMQEQQQYDGWDSLRQQLAQVCERRVQEKQQQQQQLNSHQKQQRQPKQPQPEEEVSFAFNVKSSYQHQLEQEGQHQEQEEEVQNTQTLEQEHVKLERTPKSFSSSSSSGICRPSIDSEETEKGAEPSPSGHDLMIKAGVVLGAAAVAPLDTAAAEGAAAGATVATGVGKGFCRLPQRLKSLNALSVAAAQLEGSSEQEPAKPLTSSRAQSEQQPAVAQRDVAEKRKRGSWRVKVAAGQKKDQDKTGAVVVAAEGVRGKADVGVGPGGGRGLFPAPYPSRYRRVCWDSCTGRWIAQINVQVRGEG